MYCKVMISLAERMPSFVSLLGSFLLKIYKQE
jgi:hypothetical protein